MITLSGLSQTYDGSQKAVTATTNPPGLATVSVTYAGSPVPPTGAGSSVVVASLSAANYEAPTVTETLVVAKATQTIAFGTLPNKVYGDPPFTVSAAATSGLPVAFAASGTCTVASTTVSLTGSGTCTITATQTGNGNYSAAPSVSQSFTVTPPPCCEISIAVSAPTVRRGQTISITGVVRNITTVNQTVTVEYEVSTPYKSKLGSFSVTIGPSKTNTTVVPFKVPANAQLGVYSLKLTTISPTGVIEKVATVTVNP
jgi:hypothetical protein